jgi:hypothetical protein
MKLNDVMRLKKGSQIKHQRYGLCEVKEVTLCGDIFFGVVLTPLEPDGKQLLATDSGCAVADLMEASIRRISNK